MTPFAKHPRLLDGLIILLALLLVLAYAGLARFHLGFPLDDGWIHQTYARNLAASGRWEYVPGVKSAGSTAPLWTAWLALGYWLHLPTALWTFGSGAFCLAWLGMMVSRLWRLWWGGENAGIPWLLPLTAVGLWPLVWAASSGMETALFAALAFSLVYVAARLIETATWHWAAPIGLGLLAGLLILTRPDGVLLAGLTGLSLFLSSLKRRTSGQDTKSQRENRGSLPFWPGQYWVGYGMALLLPLLPYFAFNLGQGGSLWPNTLYAKQAEYAQLQLEPFLSRLWRLGYYSLGGPERGWRGMSGAHLLLLPGVLLAAAGAVRHDWREKQLCRSLPLLWAGGHLLSYAWRLPVTYQHGRYLQLLLPVWGMYGLAGWGDIRRWLAGQWSQWGGVRVGWLAENAGKFSYTALLLFFLLLGGQQYALDVAFVDGEMVRVAHWLAENTPPEAIIAAHDIGAIGYYAQRPLLDLAGLVSPEVIPLLANEAAVTNYVLTSAPDYLVTAPGWRYEGVVNAGNTRLLYRTNYPWTLAQGVNNMAVYQLKTP